MPELFKLPPTLIPEHFNLANYKYAITRTRIDRNLLNTLVITVSSVVLTLLFTVPAAYAFSRMKFRLSKLLQFITLIFQMISPVIIIIPLYRYFAKLGMLNNYPAMIAVYVAINIPIALWYIKGYLDTIPQAIDEAALIDGCGRVKVLWKILLPIITPSIISIGLLISIYCWAQFLVPFILIEDGAKFPISVALVNLQSTADTISTHFLAAGCIIGILPPIVIFISAQKFILSALTSGAVKE